MNDKKLTNIGRYITKLLRHDPEDLTMDKNGYVNIDEVLSKVNITRDQLDWIVNNNNKKRFAYNEDGTLIRASQGHNKKLNIKVDMIESERVDFLYHGTATRFIDSIIKNGLKPQSRHHVHLTNDMETALQVGSRKGKDITILKIDSARMRADGVKIWISDNGVYLTNEVDPKYISKLK